MAKSAFFGTQAAERAAPGRNDEEVVAVRERIAHAITEVNTILRGNRRAIELVFAAAFARGHVLLEDVPGVGKTTLARAVAKALGCSFSRIQFTSDLLPSDVLGVQVLDSGQDSFSFRKGPIFAHVVLADEINRASPKTQSAMLEAMSDCQVTIDDNSIALEQPFVVLATQNPVEHHGAYPLPESQLDRFMVRTALGYPPPEDERALLMAPRAPETALAALPSFFEPAQVRAIQARVDEVVVSPALADYLLAVVHATRNHPDVLLGCSPRGALAFAALARAWAFTRGRGHVLPDDVKALATSVLAHRLVVASSRTLGRGRDHATLIVEDILGQVPAPR